MTLLAFFFFHIFFFHLISIDLFSCFSWSLKLPLAISGIIQCSAGNALIHTLVVQLRCHLGTALVSWLIMLRVEIVEGNPCQCFRRSQISIINYVIKTFVLFSPKFTVDLRASGLPDITSFIASYPLILVLAGNAGVLLNLSTEILLQFQHGWELNYFFKCLFSCTTVLFQLSPIGLHVMVLDITA